MKNKITALLLAVFLIFSSGFTTYAETQQSFNEVTLSMYCNISEKRSITGVYSNNNFYVKADDLCDVANVKIVEQTAEHMIVSSNCGVRTIKIYHATQNMTEGSKEDRLITMPVVEYENARYYSLLHFLRYLGINVSLEENAETQLKILVRYNIFDAIGEYVEKNKGNFFWWDEVECTENENLEDKLINAGVVSLINRDSNLFRMMFNASGIEREALEDVLVAILTNEGESYFDENSSDLDLQNTLKDAIGITSDVTGFLLDVLKADLPENAYSIFDNTSTGLGHFANFAVNFANAYATMKQFDTITEVQRTLLEKTILEYPENSALLCGEWKRLREAAKNVDTRAKEAYINGFDAGFKVVNSTAYDLLQGSVSKSPIAIAWNGAVFMVKLIPYTSNIIDNKTQLYNAYLCSIIQMVANELLTDAASDLNNADLMQFDATSQTNHLVEMRNALILQLKSTLTTREYLIKSEFLAESYAEEMKIMNKQTAELLNKIENCKIVLAGMDPSVTEDLTWMENYESQDSNETINFWEDIPDNFIFSSGVGAWSTEITIADDGTFTGKYHDSNMSDSGSGYPNGTVYICDFRGKFTMPQKINEYIYSMNLEFLEVDGTPGTEYYENDIRYIVSDPNGFDNADEFLVYLPGCPLAETAEEFLSWSFVNTKIRNTIPTGVYGIYNVGGSTGFVGEDDDSLWRKTYTHVHNSYKSELQPSYNFESHLNFWPPSGAATLILGFDWSNDSPMEFVASDYNGSGEYNISLDFNEDFTSVKVTLKSISGFNLEPWGGSADGTLSVEYYSAERPETSETPETPDNNGGTPNNTQTDIPGDATFFNGNYYKIYDESLSWSDAAAFCEQLGGHLVTITSNDEQEFLTELSNLSAKKNLWIGAKIFGNNTYSWVTEEAFEYTNWADGEPNNVYNTQFTAMMYTKNSAYPAGEWNDENENGRNWTGYQLSDFGFICEWSKAAGNVDPTDDDLPEEVLFDEYIQSNLSFSNGKPYQKEGAGLVSRLIQDYDGDNIKEMVTFSIALNASDQPYIEVGFYVIDNGVVVRKNAEKSFLVDTMGVSHWMACVTYEDGIFRISRSGYSGGGTAISYDYASYQVKNKTLVYNDCYTYTFYRGDEKFVEKVSEKTYSSVDEWESAVQSAGYSLNTHKHISSTYGDFDPATDDYNTASCFKGDHIFAVFNSYDDVADGIYGFICDNTGTMN